MDDQSRSLLIGGSLFLQANYPAQAMARHHSDGFWFLQRSTRNSFAGFVKCFLDSMALLLVLRPGAEFVTACTLDLPVEQPARQNFPALALRIARNGYFSPRDDQRFKNLATKIVEFIQTASNERRESISSEIFLACRPKIENCIRGGNPRNQRIDQFSSIVNKLSSHAPADYLPELENFPYAGKRFKYTRQTAGDAFSHLVDTLRIFDLKARAVNDGRWDSVSIITVAAAAIRGDKVLMHLLGQCLPKEDAKKARRFLERVGAYHIAFRTLHQIVQKRIESQPVFTGTITIALLPPERLPFTPPTLAELSASVMSENDRQSLRIPADVHDSYSSAGVELTEHCEIRLVRFYIENTDRIPAIPYLGVSKLSCFLCSSFLKHLQDRDLPGQHIEFGVRGEHGKIYGRWLPPYYIRCTGDTLDRVRGALQLVTSDVKDRVRQRLETYRVQLPLGGDSPGWSSYESSAQSPGDEEDWWEMMDSSRSL